MRLTLVLLTGVAGLQMLWLAAIWWTKATTNQRKVVALGVYNLVVGIAVLSFSIFGPDEIKEPNLSWSAPIPGPLAGQAPAPVILISLCLLTAGISLVYARYQRVWPFDEEHHYTAARLVATQGVATYFRQYADLKWLGMQHPPLIPLIGGGLMRLFGRRLFTLRLVSVVCLAGTVAVTYLIAYTLYDAVAGLLAALLLLSFPLVWRQGTAAMLDMPITFLSALALLLVLQAPHPSPSVWQPVLTGIVIGIGLLTKYSMVLIYPILLPIFIGQYGQWHSLSIIMLVSGGMLAAWLTFSAHIGVLPKQLSRLLIYSSAKPGTRSPQPQHKGILSELGITRGWRMRLRLETLFSRLPSALGAYSIPLLLLGTVSWLKAPDPVNLPVILWIGITIPLLLVVFPDHRYFLPIFPAFALLIARGLLLYSPSILPVVCLTLFYCAGDLYLFVDWSRQTYLFSRSGV